MKSIDKILKACKKNKAWAQAELFELYSDKMFGTCLYYSDNKSDAEDLLQDGFLHIFSNIEKFKGGNVEAWMRKVFINLALMEYRKKKLETLTIEEEDVYSDNSIFEGDIQQNADELMKLISELPTRYRIVFNLYAIEGYKHREIAEMLEITEGTSKSNLSRARDILQKKLHKLDDI
ncbi:MAG: RNA polymerase sigma factor [Bacteroidales bacterium]|nr:RNA polymerase sigma factor [Bacteroidales bacterium]